MLSSSFILSLKTDKKVSTNVFIFELVQLYHQFERICKLTRIDFPARQTKTYDNGKVSDRPEGRLSKHISTSSRFKAPQ